MSHDQFPTVASAAPTRSTPPAPSQSAAMRAGDSAPMRNFAFPKLDPAFRRLPTKRKGRPARILSRYSPTPSRVDLPDYSTGRLKAIRHPPMADTASLPDDFQSNRNDQPHAPRAYLSMAAFVPVDDQAQQYLDKLDPFHPTGEPHDSIRERKYLFV